MAGTTWATIGDADGDSGGSGLDDEGAELRGVVSLRTDETEDELVVGFIEAGRVDDVGGLDGVDEIEESDPSGLQPGEAGDDVELGDLSALDDDGADAGDAIERGTEVVGCQLPERSGGDGRRSAGAGRIDGEGVAEDGECGEGELMGGDFGGGRELLLDLGEGGVGELQGEVHVTGPIEEEADLSGAAAGGAADGDEAGDAVDRVLDGLGDGDLHLLDGHDAVIDADDDAGKVGIGKDRDGNLKRGVDAREGERDEKEEDGPGMAGKPEERTGGAVVRVVRTEGRRWRSLVVASFPAGFPAVGLSSAAPPLSSSALALGSVPILTLVPSSRP